MFSFPCDPSLIPFDFCLNFDLQVLITFSVFNDTDIDGRTSNVSEALNVYN